jgi:S1-C subfamily serine protease
MVDKPRWEVPDAQQPRPEEVSFDLDQTLRSIVNIEAQVPADAFTAASLGAERAGSGIVIRETGLVLTIGYLVTEAQDVTLIDDEGRATPAHPIAIDSESGFALVQALGPLNLPAVPLGARDVTPAARGSSRSRNFRAIGNITSTTRCSPRRRIRSGAARVSSVRTGG